LEENMANCTNCGKPLKEGVKFCTSCGTPVKSGASTKSAAAAKPAASEKPATVAKSAAAESSAAPERAVVMNEATYETTDEVVSTLNWFGTLLVLVIPIVGLVLYFVWAFGNSNRNRRNYCRAALIMMAIGLVGCIISGVMLYSWIESLNDPFYGLDTSIFW
jgi:heme/copper-type cytochrome/quinol oxidase subunit 2